MDIDLTELADLLLVLKKADETGNILDKYIRKQKEILELQFISKMYFLENAKAVEHYINKKNNELEIKLYISYFVKRWEKFYSKEYNKEFGAVFKSNVLRRDGLKCSYCGYTKNIEIHHVIPQKQKGPNSVFNCVSACENCNRSIGNNIVIPNNWWLLHPESRNRIV